MPENHNIPLTNEIHMPLVGLGTYLIPDDEAPDLVSLAIRIGYRHIDTAEIYQNETGVGTGIRKGMEAEGLTRADLFVTTKLWPGKEEWGHAPKTYETTLAALEESLERLQLDYVDLYLLHAPLDPVLRLEQWRGLVELQKQGKTRAIGVSNFGEAHIDQLVDAGLPMPSANQIELHPWSQKPALIQYLRNNDILPIAYSSLVPLSTWREGEASGKTDAMRADSQAADAPFKQLAAKHGVTEAQVLLRWGVQKGYPVLPKSRNPERLQQNFDLFSFSLDDSDMAAIEKMDRGDGVAWSVGDPVKMA